MDGYGHAPDKFLRFYDLLANPLTWVSFSLTTDPGDDFSFTAGIRIAGADPEEPPLFDFPLAQIRFVWADISRPLDVRVEPVAAPGSPAELLMRLLSFTPSDFVNEFDRLLTSLDKLQALGQVDVELPFGGNFKLSTAFNFAQAFRDRVLSKFADQKLEIGRAHV